MLKKSRLLIRYHFIIELLIDINMIRILDTNRSENHKSIYLYLLFGVPYNIFQKYHWEKWLISPSYASNFASLFMDTWMIGVRASEWRFALSCWDDSPIIIACKISLFSVSWVPLHPYLPISKGYCVGKVSFMFSTVPHMDWERKYCCRIMLTEISL